MENYKMAHTMIRVFDLERSVAYYNKALGLVEIRRRDEPKHAFTLVFLGDGQPNGYQLELTYNYNPETSYDIGTGFGHLALFVENLEASHEFHEKNGFEPTKLKGLDPNGKTRYYFITDPDGYRIEIIRK